MRILLTILIFIPSLVFGQKGIFLIHTLPPAGPVLTTPVTFTTANAYTRSSTFAGYAPSSVGKTNNTTTGIDMIFNDQEPFGMQWNFGPGSVANPWRFTPGSVTTRFGSSLSLSHGFQTIGNGNNVMLMGSPTIPFVLKAGAGQCGVQIISQSGGANFLASNVIVRNTQPVVGGVLQSPSGAGFQLNSKTSNAGYYNSIIITDCLTDSTGAEGIYIGGTNSPNSQNDSISSCHIKNFRAAYAWREFAQFHSGKNILVENISCYSSGNEGTAGQNNLTQWQDVNGLMQNSVLSGGPAFANISCVGCKFKNMYWGTTGVNQGFFVDVNTNFSTSPRTLSPGIYGDTAIFEGVIFNKETAGAMGGTGYAFDDNVSSHVVIFRNCILSDKFVDFADPTHTKIIGRIGDHGNVKSSTIVTPQFISLNSQDPNFMILNTPVYIKLHMGAYIP